jgi:hypothetical protein
MSVVASFCYKCIHFLKSFSTKKPKPKQKPKPKHACPVQPVAGLPGHINNSFYFCRFAYSTCHDSFHHYCSEHYFVLRVVLGQRFSGVVFAAVCLLLHSSDSFWEHVLLQREDDRTDLLLPRDVETVRHFSSGNFMSLSNQWEYTCVCGGGGGGGIG